MMELIDRQALIADYRICGVCNNFESCNGYVTMCDSARMRQAINEAPTIEPEVRHGRWIEVTKHRDENGTILIDYECSECCAMVKDSDAEEIESERFCYNCGCAMTVTDTNVGGKGGADNG